ncbi:helicase-associated domain-containing protein [Brevibacillus laterosporus]|uniref:DNA 3'-5' helicase n=1 Tax=Brevibacillus halotolerans TaxID=1507437 RepID=A0ABT4HYW9_9BACL|nr:DNA repair helicase XPB [Brevibacillus laterosporus]MCR8985948.1 helicase-associated domain-containing protein [Brevibacillus laterosporus]MCZ0831681.1 helicase-associated domain-containing protein [Brevibacillus halotolerans]
MSFQPHLPLIVQSDRSILVEVENPLFDEARQAISGFAELIKSPEYIHTYRLTPLSLWNAAASQLQAEQILETLSRYSKYGLPPSVADEVKRAFSRYGLIQMHTYEDQIGLTSADPLILAEVMGYQSMQPYIEEKRSESLYILKPYSRGLVKQALIKLGYPVQDLAGYQEGEPCPMELVPCDNTGTPFALRDYQLAAVDAFYANGTAYGGSGVLCLPCGAGKTIIGIGTMSRFETATLILTTSTTSVRQWINEIITKTTLTADMVGEYTGEQKEVRPVTVTTYQMVTSRQRGSEEFPHMNLFTDHNWGLIIYDEVHMLPAPIFKMTSSIQAKRRLGLTATLVREDGKEDEVFSLIGPKKYEMPWKALEAQGWIATALCKEVRLPLPSIYREAYAFSSTREKYRLAAENPIKVNWVQKLLRQHKDDHILIIGQYIKQLELVANTLGLPLITGKTPEEDRGRYYEMFKRGEIKQLVISKVANFAVDLPDANVAIQISGTFGSRQEEAQRLGRILRPKATNQAYFYTLVSRDTREQEFASKRQMFLLEQGYHYQIIEPDEVPENIGG